MNVRSALTALTVGTGLATAPAAHAGDVECRGTLGAVTVVGSVIVPDDATCVLDGTSVQGSVVVKSRATLRATGITMSGTVAGQGPGTVDVRSSSIGNGFSVTEGEPVGSVTLASSSVTGDVSLADNRGPVDLGGNEVGGSIRADENTGCLEISANRTVNGLQCQDNLPAPTGGGDVAAQKQGQCVSLQGARAERRDLGRLRPRSRPASGPACRRGRPPAAATRRRRGPRCSRRRGPGRRARSGCADPARGSAPRGR